MTKPLILLLYQRLLPGGQLVHRLEDLGYRVRSLGDPARLEAESELERPFLVMADLELGPERVGEAIVGLRGRGETAHIPVIAFAGVERSELMEMGREAGATLVVNDAAIVLHLEQFLEQALRVD